MSNYREGRIDAGAPGEERVDSHSKTHAELVQAFRTRINQRTKITGASVPPHAQIERDLRYKYLTSPCYSDKERFFFTLLAAWELLTYDRLEPGSLEEDRAARTISISKEYRDNPTIRLNDTQVRLLDAMAEASGIPRPRTQSVIKITDRNTNSGSRPDSLYLQRSDAGSEERLGKAVKAYKSWRG